MLPWMHCCGREGIGGSECFVLWYGDGMRTVCRRDREYLHPITYLNKIILPRRQIYNHIRMQDTLIVAAGDTSGIMELHRMNRMRMEVTMTDNTEDTLKTIFADWGLGKITDHEAILRARRLPPLKYETAHDPWQGEGYVLVSGNPDNEFDAARGLSYSGKYNLTPERVDALLREIAHDRGVYSPSEIRDLS